MRNFYALMTVVGSLAIGYGIGHIVGRRTSLEEANLEAERYIEGHKAVLQKKFEAAIGRSDDDEIVESPLVPKDPEEDPDPPIIRYNDLALATESVTEGKDYTKFAEAQEREKAREENPSPEVYEPLEEEADYDLRDNTVWIDMDNNGHPSYESDIPVWIPVEEFTYDDNPYETVTLEYFKRDRLVTDWKYVPVDNVTELIGDALGILDRGEQGDTDVIFVRNNQLEIDFEVILNEEPIKEAIKERAKLKEEMRNAKRNH